MSKFWIFLTSVWQEAKKINWPTRKELLNSTIIVLIIIAFVAVYLFAVDFGLLQFFTLLVYPVFLRNQGSGIP
ncbi:preprotein translocase subunit SecE [Petrotoga sp. 9PWA.NaAc.5.4]|uniref:preprotein translocase subunit SecE n=1 Tax=Petrotoga sp. 9PWA.NaAc.5.4 TaxID=1434328 RepID=UPI000CBB05B0|nr:preprotein translocase subunit SecE [Petrotoga sp. 9PWA.NaAc.5.4]PNR95943.1 preprotein translocase subunit SecE [Petrotoga sp. 9PWA.NaAc.5.4]